MTVPYWINEFPSKLGSEAAWGVKIVLEFETAWELLVVPALIWKEMMRSSERSESNLNPAPNTHAHW